MASPGYSLNVGAQTGNMSTVTEALENGANNYSQAMAYAAVNGHIDIVKLMSERGANDFDDSNVVGSSRWSHKYSRVNARKGSRY